jgi:hypothetical protein
MPSYTCCAYDRLLWRFDAALSSIADQPRQQMGKEVLNSLGRVERLFLSPLACFEFFILS